MLGLLDSMLPSNLPELRKADTYDRFGKYCEMGMDEEGNKHSEA